MGKIVGVRFEPGGRVYDFDAGHFVLTPDNHVIVETEQGLALGTVVTSPRAAVETEAKTAMPQVYRLANEEDFKQHTKNFERAKAAHAYCLECIDKLDLEMNLVSVESLFDGTKLTFYYTADGRVDFRELVKMLVKEYRVRIEMRQIGVRNRAKMSGGVGRCGRELCCCTCLTDFQPVSVRMAKEQGLSLNPSKISGLCGRLMCCLAYEHKTYLDLKHKFPRLGKVVRTEKGTGKVISQDLLRESVTIESQEGKPVEVSLKEIIEKPDRAP